MPDSVLLSLTLTKLQRPRTGRALLRPHLLERLNASQSLTLVLAPAGYGKTTLLSTWLETCAIPHVWLSLDEHDDAPTVFVTYLIEALRTMFPEATSHTLASISGSITPPAEVMTRTLLNDLAALQQEFILVLDDYHVIRNKAIHDLLTDLVRHAPRALHLVVTSRHDPPLPLAGLRARGHVLELRAADLRFTLDEIAEFLREVMALEIDEQTIALLAAKTEGWPAGLRLAALSLQHQHVPGMIARNVLGDNRYVMDYLLAEVLAQLPISVQEFLIKASILDQLCGPLCEAVTGVAVYAPGGQPMLDWLERTDVFVTPVDEHRQWYRCHHLFRQLLRHRLEQLHGLAEMAALHQRASAWFAANGYVDEALHHALAAGDIQAAVQIVAQHRHSVLNQVQWQRLGRWLHLFPRDVIETQPDLLLIEIGIKLDRQQLAGIPALLDRVETLIAQLPPDKAAGLKGEVEARRSALYFWGGDFPRSATTARHALASLPVEWWYIRSYTRLFVSVNHLMAGDLPAAYETLYAPGESIQSEDHQIVLIGLACLIHWIAADLPGMALAARQILAVSHVPERSELLAWTEYYAGLYRYQRNDLAAAEKYLLSLVMQPYRSHALCFLNSAVLLARVRQAQGQPQAGREILEVLLAHALETQSDVLLAAVRAFQAELDLRDGHLTKAALWAEQSGVFKPTPLVFLFMPPVVQAQILLAQNTPAARQQARELLSHMDEYFTPLHYTTVRIQVLVLQAMLHYAEGNQAEALAVFSRSIALAAPGGFLRLFVDLGPAVIPLLRRLARRGGAVTYLNDILAAFGTGEALPSVGPLLDPPSRSTTPAPAGLTAREQDVLALLNKRCTDKEIADALSISVDTVRSHIRHLGEKLEAHGRRAIVQSAKEQGLLD
jgi:LuxR family maltose regulon positive regulatory protein